MAITTRDEMRDKVATASGFIAALDQSGGSTPKALAHYGVAESAYSGDEEMFDLVHRMRTRIITSPSFTGEKILGAILFEGTMDRQVEGRSSADYLWSVKNVVPFVKVDKGLAELHDDAQVMKPMPQLAELLQRAVGQQVFGTKMRSVVKAANPAGIAAVVDQQFDVGEQILDAGLVPIIEPEVDIHATDKEKAEALLLEGIMRRIEALPAGAEIMLKLTIPSVDGFYSGVMAHPQVLRVVALSGGYSRDEANERLARNPGLIASFSRALIQDLSAQQSDQEFDTALAAAIDSIHRASAS
ncbi:MAG: fructose bisphosphate aldolase [Actinomycetales bacterium]